MFIKWIDPKRILQYKIFLRSFFYKKSAYPSAYPKIAYLLVFSTLFINACAYAPRHNFAQSAAPGSLALPKEAAQRVNMQLYFVSQDGARLVPEFRAIELNPYESRAAVAVKELLKGPQNAELKRVFWPGTELVGLEAARGVTTVHLSETFEQMFASDRTLAKAALIQTLHSLDGTRYLTALSGAMEPGYDGKPTGVMEYFTEDYDLYQSRLRQRMQTRQTDAAPGTSYSAERVDTFFATLYFADASGRFLLPEVRQITVSGLGYARAILEELQKGPSPLSGLNATLSNYTVRGTPSVEILESGRANVRLDIVGEGQGDALAVASAVCSLASFIPTAERITVSLNGAPITRLTMPGFGEAAFVGGMFTRESFSGLLGAEATLLFANDSGSLTRVSRTMRQSEVMNPDYRLQELLKGPQPGEDAQLLPVLPGADFNDVPHVTISGETAWLDCSKSFAAAAAKLSSTDGFLLIYALVNTVCEFPDVKRVQFLIEGEGADSLAGNVYIRTPLLKNPGLIRE